MDIPFVGGVRKATPEEAAILNRRLNEGALRAISDKVNGHPTPVQSTRISYSGLTIR